MCVHIHLFSVAFIFYINFSNSINQYADDLCEVQFVNEYSLSFSECIIRETCFSFAYQTNGSKWVLNVNFKLVHLFYLGYQLPSFQSHSAYIPRFLFTLPIIF